MMRHKAVWIGLVLLALSNTAEAQTNGRASRRSTSLNGAT